MGRSEAPSGQEKRIRRAVFKPAAEAELLDAHSWYEQRQAGLGGEFLRCVDACLASLRRNPESHPMVHKQVRMALAASGHQADPHAGRGRYGRMGSTLSACGFPNLFNHAKAG